MAAAVRTASLADRDAVLDLWLELIEYHRSIDPDYPNALGIRDHFYALLQVRRPGVLDRKRGAT